MTQVYGVVVRGRRGDFILNLLCAQCVWPSSKLSRFRCQLNPNDVYTLSCFHLTTKITSIMILESGQGLSTSLVNENHLDNVIRVKWRYGDNFLVLVCLVGV